MGLLEAVSNFSRGGRVDTARWMRLPRAPHRAGPRGGAQVRLSDPGSLAKARRRGSLSG